MSVISTPNSAKQLSLEIAAQCFNDEIRAHFALGIVSRIVPHNDPKIAAATEAARAALSALTAAYDRQYRD